ncbi:MAG TPA: peptidase M16 [Rhodobacteraceae bacterium]|jgi:predicted Zn-dependent peptidase|nr:peptidase M16 [Paracoccaceae bacterium]
MSIQFHTLSNGFRIVTENMPSLESASLGIWVAAGGRHERVEQNGIAHFLEHMAFKGTKTRSSLDIAEAIEDVGGFINAYTSREMTAYYVRVLGGDVPLALDVISDVLLNPVFDPKEIEIERGVILQEIGQSLDTPDDVVFDWLQEAAYPKQAIGRSILGPAERVKSFNRNDLNGFVSEQYGPEQLILSAAGAVDHDSLVAEAERLFGGLARGTSTAVEPAKFEGGEIREVKDLEQAHFTMAFEGPNYLADDIFTAQIFASAFGGGMSSRLFQEVREKRGLCYTIFSQASAFVDSGMLMIYAGTSGDQLTELAEITVDEIKRAADDMSEVEIARARTQMKAGMLMGLESPASRAERMARLVMIYGQVPPLAETIAKIDAVDVAGVRNFAAGLAQNANAALALYGPVADAPMLDNLKTRLMS